MIARIGDNFPTGGFDVWNQTALFFTEIHWHWEVLVGEPIGLDES